VLTQLNDRENIRKLVKSREFNLERQKELRNLYLKSIDDLKKLKAKKVAALKKGRGKNLRGGVAQNKRLQHRFERGERRYKETEEPRIVGDPLNININQPAQGGFMYTNTPDKDVELEKLRIENLKRQGEQALKERNLDLVRDRIVYDTTRLEDDKNYRRAELQQQRDLNHRIAELEDFKAKTDRDIRIDQNEINRLRLEAERENIALQRIPTIEPNINLADRQFVNNLLSGTAQETHRAREHTENLVRNILEHEGRTQQQFDPALLTRLFETAEARGLRVPGPSEVIVPAPPPEPKGKGKGATPPPPPPPPEAQAWTGRTIKPPQSIERMEAPMDLVEELKRAGGKPLKTKFKMPRRLSPPDKSPSDKINEATLSELESIRGKVKGMMAASRPTPEEQKQDEEANAYIDEQEARLVELGIDDPPSPVQVFASDEARARLDLPSGETPAEQEEMDISRHAENLLEEQRKRESDSFVEVDVPTLEEVEAVGGGANAPAPPFSQLATEIPSSPPPQLVDVSGGEPSKPHPVAVEPSPEPESEPSLLSKKSKIKPGEETLKVGDTVRINKYDNSFEFDSNFLGKPQENISYELPTGGRQYYLLGDQDEVTKIIKTEPEPSMVGQIAGAVGGAISGAVVGAVSGGADIVARVAGGAAGAVGDALWEAAPALPVLPDASDVGRGVAEGLMAAGGAAVRGVVGAGAGLVEALVEDTPAAVVTDEGELLEEVVAGEAQAPEIRDSLSLYGNEFLTDASLLAGRSGPRGARDEDIRPQYEIVNRTNKEYKGIPAGGSAPVTAYQTDAFGYTTGSGVRGIKRTKYTTLQKEIEKGRLLLKKL
tara:strand:- start:1854 stop:4352 length:2499 start_codon:yes stop_codon:yes gene_type:complete